MVSTCPLVSQENGRYTSAKDGMLFKMDVLNGVLAMNICGLHGIHDTCLMSAVFFRICYFVHCCAITVSAGAELARLAMPPAACNSVRPTRGAPALFAHGTAGETGQQESSRRSKREQLCCSAVHGDSQRRRRPIMHCCDGRKQK